MTDLSRSLRDYADFLDEVSVEHAVAVRELSDVTATDEVELADVIVLDPQRTTHAPDSPPGASKRRRLLLPVAAVVALGAVGLFINRAEQFDEVPLDGGTIVEVPRESEERAGAMSRLVAWVNGDLADDDFAATFGSGSRIPDWFFSTMEMELAAYGSFVVRETLISESRSERVLENGKGGMTSLIVEFDGDTPVHVDVRPTTIPDGSQAAVAMGLLDEQVQWLNGESFTETDYVRSFTALDPVGYPNHVALIGEASAGGPYEVLVRALDETGAVAVLLGSDERLSVVGLEVRNDRIFSLTFDDGTD